MRPQAFSFWLADESKTELKFILHLFCSAPCLIMDVIEILVKYTVSHVPTNLMFIKRVINNLYWLSALHYLSITISREGVHSVFYLQEVGIALVTLWFKYKILQLLMLMTDLYCPFIVFLGKLLVININELMTLKLCIHIFFSVSFCNYEYIVTLTFTC